MQFLKNLFYKPQTLTLQVTSSNGFHLRPVAQFVAEAKKYPCQIMASYAEKTVDAKAVNTLLSLSLDKGHQFLLICRGKQSKEALDSLSKTFHALMQKDKEQIHIREETHTYEGFALKGESIFGGIAIAAVYRYAPKEVHLKKEIGFQEAVEKSIDELQALYTSVQKNDDATIYLAQKELLVSLKEQVSTLTQFELLIDKESAQLLGTKLESKKSDYLDILQRVKRHLGIETHVTFPSVPFILLADDLLPSEIDTLLQTQIKGVILKETSPYSHSAILLRSAGIVSLIADTSTLGQNDTKIILDAHSAVVISTPTQSDLQKATTRLNNSLKGKEHAYAKRFQLAQTGAGKSIKIFANVTDVNSAILAKEEGAEGIGLLRSEFLFKEVKPTLKEQSQAYEEIFALFDDITVRTLDVGGDKALPYLQLPAENNPFLGIRGVRLLQTHPQLIEEQLHAIFLASQNKTIKIMFPMVSTVEEFIQAKAFAHTVANKHKLDISQLLFGIMIEVPSVLFLLEEFDAVVDFYSIGTNDLTQYLFAVERTHPVLKVDELSPVVFSAIETIVKKVSKPLSICGELASNKQAIPKLINLGIQNLSISPKSIAQTKEEIRHV